VTAVLLAAARDGTRQQRFGMWNGTGTKTLGSIYVRKLRILGKSFNNVAKPSGAVATPFDLFARQEVATIDFMSHDTMPS
jgi:hypothetical protein